MLSTLTLYFHLMLNQQFLGDTKQIEAIQAQIAKRYPSYNVEIYSYQDNDPLASTTFLKNLSKSRTGISVLITSGSHGYELLMKDPIQKLIKEKKVISVWVGHQDPAGLTKNKGLFDIVALPIHIIEDKPILTETFKTRLVAMKAVPNTLQEKDLQPALEQWNKDHETNNEGKDEDYPTNKAIPDSKDGGIGIFLGGPAPKPDGSYLYETLKAIQERGFLFGQMAIKEDKPLFIVNGPRTGKFYIESPDSKDPIIRQFNAEKGWIAFEDLTTEQKKITVNSLAKLSAAQKEEISETLAHAHATPLDPETKAFIEGIEQSGLDKNRYHIFDFKAPSSKYKQPKRSAYEAVIAALYNCKDKSIACYSGESISYAEIAYFIPQTYAFETGSMNSGHYNALRRLSQDLHMVRKLDFNKGINEQPINMSEKLKSTTDKSQQDAMQIANALEPLLKAEARKQQKVPQS